MYLSQRNTSYGQQLVDKEKERELLSKIASGNQQAFAQLMDHYTPVIYPYLLYWIKNPSLVQEVTQDIFIRVWKNREKLPGIINFPGYLYVIARNKANSALKAEFLGEKNDISEILEKHLLQPEIRVEQEELQAAIEAAIESLPPKRKEIFKRSRLEGMTYEKIAEDLKISRNTVKGHMVAALVYLRDYLEEHSDITFFFLYWMLIHL